MKIERTKNVVRTTIFGALYRIINIILPFFSRTVILYVLGTEYLGLSSLFSSILSFLSLAELGVGNAMVYSMYKPIAQNDKKTICALMNLYRRFYRWIGTIILCLGILLMPFLRKLIHGSVPEDINLYLLYFIYLMNAVLSYWLFAYKSALLQAHQRNDITSKIAMVITPVSYAVMLGCLFLTKNYYLYVIWIPIFTILTNIIRVIVVNKLFSGYEPEGEVEPELRESISKKVKALIGTKLNTVVLNAADNLVMSAFLGLTIIAMYGNYYYIMSSITGFVGIAYSAMTAGLGNSLVTETKEKNYADLLRFSFINSWIVGLCTVCLICLYQPFMKIWVGEKLMFPMYIVLEFGLYFYTYMIRKIPITYKDAGGIWWEDRFRPYVCMIVNLILNITMVRFIGVSGIILSTVFSLFISIPWENYTIFRFIFHRSSKEYYWKMFVYICCMAIAGAVCYWICSFFGEGIQAFFARMAVCVLVPNLIFAVLNYRRKEFAETINLANRIIRRKF